MDWWIFLVLFTQQGEVPRVYDKMPPAQSYKQCKQNTLLPEVQKMWQDAARIDGVNADVRCVGLPKKYVQS